jgi:pilus assembly protein CpaB
MTSVPPPGESPAGDADEGQLFTSSIIPRIQVIAAGQTTTVSRTTTDEEGQETTEEVPITILTVAATQTEAQKIIQAQRQGELTFALLTESSETGLGEQTLYGDLFE